MYSLTSPKLLFMYALYFFVTIGEWFLTVYFSIYLVFELPIYFLLFVVIRLWTNRILTGLLSFMQLSIHSTTFLLTSIYLLILSFSFLFMELPVIVVIFIFYIGIACFNYGFWSTLSDFSLNHLIEPLTKIFLFTRQIGFMIGIISVFFFSKHLLFLFILLSLFFLIMYFMMQLEKGLLLNFEKEKWNVHQLKKAPFILSFVILSISSIDYYFIYFLVSKSQFTTGSFISCLVINALAIYLATSWVKKVNQPRLIYLILPFIIGYGSLLIVDKLLYFLVINFIGSFTFVLMMHHFISLLKEEDQMDFSSLNELAMLLGVIFIGVGIIFFSITTVFTCLLLINLIILLFNQGCFRIL